MTIFIAIYRLIARGVRDLCATEAFSDSTLLVCLNWSGILLFTPVPMLDITNQTPWHPPLYFEEWYGEILYSATSPARVPVRGRVHVSYVCLDNLLNRVLEADDDSQTLDELQNE